MNVKGLSIQDLMNMSWSDLNALSEKELKEVSMRLNSAANKRLRRLESSGVSEWSPAYQHTRKSGGDFSVKGLQTKQQIKNEIQRASSFLESKTGSFKGTKAFIKKTKELFSGKKEKPPKKGEAPEKPPTEAQRKKLFRALDRLRETNAAAVYNIGSPEVIKQLRKLQKKDARTGAARLVEELEKKFPELMEDSQSRYEREEAERQARTDEDGIFRTLSPAEAEENPFK